MIDTASDTLAEHDEGTLFDSIPTVVFDNQTRFSAIYFNSVDQHDQAFHVFVAKQAFDIGPPDANGISPLRPAPGRAELVVEDRYLDGGDDGSAWCESDLAPYKPKCDVLVKGSAHAPAGKAVTSIAVCLTLQSESETLINKTLTVRGERSYRRLNKAVRSAALLANAASLGQLRAAAWTLTETSTFTSLPIRYEFSIGGAAMVAKSDPAAASIPKEHRIDDAEASEAAHQVCETNPLGRGFAPRWYLAATGKNELPAPRIVYPGEDLTAADFWDAVNGKPLPRPAGLGPIGRAWLPRRRLFGEFVNKSVWAPNEVPRLPKDFDFSYWNCAPEDQQCRLLRYGEIFTLRNLFRPRHPAAVFDKDGVGLARFRLPQQAFPLLAGNANGEVAYASLQIDTVYIDTELGRVELVWRGLLNADGRFTEVRLMHLNEAAQIQRLKAAEEAGVIDLKKRSKE